MKRRLSALEKKSAEEGIVLTEAQVQALERKKQDDEACGEIESHHPGYLGTQGRNSLRLSFDCLTISLAFVDNNRQSV
jgi:hypothetical protein